LFFVLSGFLIGGILLDARSSPNYFKTFYIRRAYRILPLYGIITARFFVSRLHFAQSGPLLPLTIPWFAYVTLTQNLWIAWLGSWGPAAMTVTWSLAVEEQFYLTAPVLIRKLKERTLVVALITVILVAPLLRVLLNDYVAHGGFSCYFLTPCRADTLCMGVLAAYAVRSARFRKLLYSRKRWLYSATSFLFLGVVYLACKRYSPFESPMNTLGLSWLGLFYTGILLIALLPGSGWAQSLLSKRWLMFLGTIAYGSYLIHMPLIYGFRDILLFFKFSQTVTSFAGGLLGVAATLVLATISWKFFEQPLLRRGRTYTY